MQFCSCDIIEKTGVEAFMCVLEVLTLA